MFANSGNILTGKPVAIPFYGTRVTSKIPRISKIWLFYDMDKMFDPVPFLSSAKATLLSKVGKLGMIWGYFLTGTQYYGLIKSIVTTPDFENSKWILY